MNRMLEEFISESRELLEKAGEALLKLERQPQDTELINRVFRAVHTVKGASGLFDILPFTRVVHAAEDLLDVVREGRLMVDSEMADLFLNTMDQLARWLGELSAQELLNEDAPDISGELTDGLRALIPIQPSKQEEPTSLLAIEALASKGPEWLSLVPSETKLEIFQVASAAPERLYLVEYTPDERCFFSGDDPLYTARQAPGLLWLGIIPLSPWPSLDEFDPYSCNVRLHLICRGSQEELRDLFRYVEQEVRIAPLSPSALVEPTGTMGEGDVFSQFLEDAGELVSRFKWNELAGLVDLALQVSGPDLLQGSALRWLKAVLQTSDPEPKLVDSLLETIAGGQWPNPGQFAIDRSQGFADIETKSLGRDQNQKSLLDAAAELLKAQLKLLSIEGNPELRNGRIGAAASALERISQSLDWGEITGRLKKLGSDGSAKIPVEKLTQLAQIGLEVLEGAAFPMEDTHLVRAARELIEAQMELLDLDADSTLIEGRIASAGRVFGAITASLNLNVPGRLSEVLSRAKDERNRKLLREAGQKIADMINRLGTPGGSDERSSAAVTKSSMPASPQASKNVDNEVLDPCESPQNSNGTAAAPTSIRSLKVDVSRVDSLMDLVGELVVAKNALPYLARRAQDDFSVPLLSRDIKNQYGVINRITEELQAAVMQVRMTSVSNVFQRFPRLVRDLARRQNKRIQLILQGEETEADKNIVEDLAEPLIHLIRNSIDHAIELPEERRSAGKSEEGQIVLSARQNHDRVEIVVTDDGRGIDPERIKRKSYEKGLITEEQLDLISDQEAIQLIFAPGFSTAEEVSDISGRGVGMDAVRSVVDRVGGAVNLKSEMGRGTEVMLNLPLSMAVTRVMMVEAERETYGIPMDQIQETVSIATDRIHRIKNRETLVFRGRLMPLYRLKKILDIHPASRDNERSEEYVLVLNVGGVEAGVVVDRFSEDIDVILKPLEGILSGNVLFSGSALLGDGRVLLVLDPKELLTCR